MGGPYPIPQLTKILTDWTISNIPTAVLSNKVINLKSQFNYHHRNTR